MRATDEFPDGNRHMTSREEYDERFFARTVLVAAAFSLLQPWTAFGRSTVESQ